LVHTMPKSDFIRRCMLRFLLRLLENKTGTRDEGQVGLRI
jgi:hypothetical protein